jgi:hypothetical protein
MTLYVEILQKLRFINLAKKFRNPKIHQRVNKLIN